MALDVYVMPLWRFKAGDFEAPIEQNLRLEPSVVSVDGVEKPSRRRTGGLARWLHRSRARREVRAVRKAVEAANRVKVRWKDEGPVAYSHQSPGMEALRAYARWLDCRDRFPTFDAPPERDYYKHPVMNVQLANPTCAHLIGHSCFNGYYLPADFEQVAEVEPYLVFGWFERAFAQGTRPDPEGPAVAFSEFPPSLGPVGRRESCISPASRDCRTKLRTWPANHFSWLIETRNCPIVGLTCVCCGKRNNGCLRRHARHVNTPDEFARSAGRAGFVYRRAGIHDPCQGSGPCHPAGQCRDALSWWAVRCRPDVGPGSSHPLASLGAARVAAQKRMAAERLRQQLVAALAHVRLGEQGNPRQIGETRYAFRREA